MTELCEHELFSGTYYEPPEYCENEAVEDGLCGLHMDRTWDRADAAYARRKEESC